MMEIKCCENFRAIEKELYQDEYTRHFDWIDCKEIFALDNNCDCGNRFVYKGFKGKSYRAFAVCEECGKYFEF